MDVLSLIGLILAFVAIVGGNFLEGGHVGALINGPAALIVLGGTLAAALLQSPLSSFKRALQILRWILFPPRVDLAGGIDRVVNWSLTARKEGLLGLESVADSEPDPYARKGLQLLVDGAEPEAIRSILEVDFLTQEARDIQAAKVFESMGGYAPTIGIIGAVMGLIHVMGNLADPSQLGNGIAVAFVATIYGVASANLILLPIANKLKANVMRQSRYREMLLEGLLSIAEGENPRSIELKLQGFME
ncbi:TPA: flagellar motor protein [Pseudomonas putida]|jgi:chemotaxis protein MotA|uniref:MotA/TolQ/ExbB proton channel n=1 Tax=Pseudomonas putida (strain GB-1) TaxID=76869 RepID=B0KQW9_PSEPG|nr:MULTISPECIES: flagellar motor protein [Pseudomonas]ABY99795.1 MotA/TolQ/ExbB proton channel [Pseudomonas putida GB-1]APE99978.1 flagellar motor protein [Pseudomonas putida]MBP0708127.1 flagellar motor protein [Pseudomonas sp. T34]MCE0999129.1 flagellar motor protein [Pseudomonas sp. NMI1173_11]MCK2187565.1 flagellar motor protein [Pseudomonas sp. MB04B]